MTALERNVLQLLNQDNLGTFQYAAARLFIPITVCPFKIYSSHLDGPPHVFSSTRQGGRERFNTFYVTMNRTSNLVESGPILIDTVV